MTRRGGEERAKDRIESGGREKRNKTVLWLPLTERCISCRRSGAGWAKTLEDQKPAQGNIIKMPIQMTNLDPGRRAAQRTSVFLHILRVITL